MARCPTCDYDLSSLPGVPRAAAEAFGVDVRCPECGHDFPAGTLLLSGSAFVATLQPATRRARVRAMLLSFAPALWLVFQGIEGLVEELEGLGLVYYDDFFELSGNWPDWLRLLVMSIGS